MRSAILAESPLGRPQRAGSHAAAPLLRVIVMKALHPLERAMLAALRRDPLTAPGDRVLVCVSGGPDSMALLRLFYALRDRLAVRLEVLHFNHGLRPESASDAEWVAERVRPLGLPFHLRTWCEGAKIRSGIQAAARGWRQAEALALRTERDAQSIATGHQRGDHLETILLKLLRGVHLAHIRGLAARNGPWIRPLLPFARESLTGYLTEMGETWLEDPTNTSPRYKRNRIRHELLPLLDDLTGGALATRLESVERQSAALEEWLGAQPAIPGSGPGESPPWLDGPRLEAVPPLVRADQLHRFIQERMPGSVETRTLERAAQLIGTGRARWSLHLSRGRILARHGERVILERPNREPASVHVVGPWRVCVGGGLAISLRALGYAAAGEEPAPRAVGGTIPGVPLVIVHNLADDARLVVRTRRDGDRFHPPWREHPVKLGEFLRARRIASWERERLPLLVADGKVVAVYPHCVAWGHERPARGVRSLAMAVEF